MGNLKKEPITASESSQLLKRIVELTREVDSIKLQLKIKTKNSKVLTSAVESVGVIVCGEINPADSIKNLKIKWRGSSKESLIETMVLDTKLCREAFSKANKKRGTP